MSDFHKIRISLDTAGMDGEIFLDEQRLSGVTAIEYRAAVGEPSSITITLIPSVVEITGLGQLSRRYARLDPAGKLPYYDEDPTV